MSTVVRLKLAAQNPALGKRFPTMKGSLVLPLKRNSRTGDSDPPTKSEGTLATESSINVNVYPYRHLLCLAAGLSLAGDVVYSSKAASDSCKHLPDVLWLSRPTEKQFSRLRARRVGVSQNM